jgi:hypothetical protein
VMTAIVVALSVHLAFHVGAGHIHHRYHRAHGLQPRLHWSLGRGPYGSIRLPGGFRVGHRL